MSEHQIHRLIGSRSILGFPRRTPRRPGRRCRPEVSSLEGRELLSTFTVRNLNDSGTGSLRARSRWPRPPRGAMSSISPGA